MGLIRSVQGGGHAGDGNRDAKTFPRHRVGNAPSTPRGPAIGTAGPYWVKGGSQGGKEGSMVESIQRLSADDIAAETGELLPDKEVFSLLDLFVNIDLALDLAAPVDLAVAANANVAAPIDAAVAANVLSLGSTAEALADQGVMIDQHLSGDAIATAPQDASIDQSNDVVDGGTTGTTGDAGAPVAGGTTDTGAGGTMAADGGTLVDG